MITILGAGGVTEIIHNFGVNPAYLLAQFVNFILVILILKKFAFGPILEILETRKSRILAGEEKLRQIEKQFLESEAVTVATFERVNQDAKRLIEEAKESATKIAEVKNQEAIATAQSIIARAQEAAKAEQEKLAAELKREFGRLLALTTANVTGKVLNDDDKARINEESIAAFKG
jgi:F-type H+-transporting ATPase subunit b